MSEQNGNGFSGDPQNGNIQDVAESVLKQARETSAAISADASRAAADLRRNLRRNAETAKEKASDSLLNSAEAIRNEAHKSNNEEVVRQAQSLARSMEKAALYLDSRTLDQLGNDAQTTVKQNVWSTLGIVAALGFLLGMLLGGGRRR
jgi:ElaB/YqjD/DUF883 family membrane-anchored ribosome-binding protein